MVNFLHQRGIQRPLVERFWEKVERGPGCWLWQGAVTQSGYGAIGMGGKGGKLAPAHRVALILSGVDLPDDAMACHRCDVRLCVRPSHLYVGSATTNNRDTASRNPLSRVRPPTTGAHIAAGLREHYREHPRPRMTSCKRGHEFTEANSLWNRRTGKRQCRRCAYDAQNAKRAQTRIGAV